MNLAGGFERGPPRADRPRAALVLAHGEKRNQAQQMIARPDEARDGRLFEPVTREKFRGVLLVELSQLRFNSSANSGDFCARP